MNKERLERFKRLLSIPSHSLEEDEMIEYITSLLDNDYPDVEYYLDHMNNIYITKKDFHYTGYLPCYVAHTDTVHQIEDIVIHEGKKKRPFTFGKDFEEYGETDILYALTPDGEKAGIGGDDKAGIFTTLEILRLLPNCKVALFVSEEIGCVGSREADVNFFNDVSFICEFDAPGDHLITYICSGVQLFDKNGEFYTQVKPMLEKSYGGEMTEGIHPYTDVMALREKTNITCINLSCGYYNMHSKNEFIVLEDVEKAISAGVSISAASNKKYLYK